MIPRYEHSEDQRRQSRNPKGERFTLTTTFASHLFVEVLATNNVLRQKLKDLSVMLLRKDMMANV